MRNMDPYSSCLRSIVFSLFQFCEDNSSWPTLKPWQSNLSLSTSSARSGAKQISFSAG